MRVAIAGAHGQIAIQLIPLLAERGDSVVGLIRNPAHADDVREAGAEPVVLDLEQAQPAEIAAAIAGADAAVFAAGAGPGSSAERKVTMDRDGAIKLLDASRDAGVARYVVVSAVGAESPPDGDDVFSVYLRAKAEADEAVMASETDWVIVRPGGLTNDPGTGCARIDATPFRGRVARADVAAVLAALIPEPRGARRVLYVNGGEQPIADALATVLANA
jgi:nucleoside-diphosphate-sugar epimerase